VLSGLSVLDALLVSGPYISIGFHLICLGAHPGADVTGLHSGAIIHFSLFGWSGPSSLGIAA
jgi:hypothetical protein